MEVEVTTLSRRGIAIMRRSQRVSGDRVNLGRGTDNEVSLNDIHVGLRAAALILHDGVLTVERLDNSLLEVNGETIQTAALAPGDKIRLGPFQITILPQPEGCDGAIQIEQLATAGTSEQAAAGARIGLERTGASKRVYAWSGFLVIAVACLAAPIIVFSGGLIRPWHKDTANPKLPAAIGLSWNIGEFSNAHRFFAADCTTCHQGAVPKVADTACLACHAKVGSHTPHGVALAGVGDRLASLGCTDCHTEHRGIEGSVIRTAGLCLDCHRNLNEASPAAGVQDIGGFPSGHPQFRATLVAADAAQVTTVRAVLGATPPPVNHPGLKFSHKAHMDTLDWSALGDRRVKGCDSCHVAEPSGQGFQPITYKNQCEHCHELTFDKIALPWQDAKVPHGDDGAVVGAVWNFYAARAVHDGIAVPPADVQASISEKTLAVLKQVVFEEKRGCAYCHYGLGANGSFDTDRVVAAVAAAAPEKPKLTAPVSLLARFLPQARFDHVQHRGMKCEDCHTVREMQSDGVEALMIPGKENCVRCHGAEDAALRAQSTCITCHEFHRSEFGLMHMIPSPMTTGATQ